MRYLLGNTKCILFLFLVITYEVAYLDGFYISIIYLLVLIIHDACNVIMLNFLKMVLI